MERNISQRELRNESGGIMRRVQQGEFFTVTSNGEPVAELVPLRRRRLVAVTTVLEIFRKAPSVDFTEFRVDLDQLADQGIEPRD